MGAAPRDLRRAVVRRSATIWLVMAGLAAGVLGWAQGLLAGLPQTSLVPLSFTQVFGVLAVAGASVIVGALIGLGRILRKDSADIMRALE